METDTAQAGLVCAGALAPAAAAPPRERAAQVQAPAVRVLSLDAHGRAMDWIGWQDATCLYARDAVAWTLGNPCLQIRGGICRATGARSLVQLHPIVATRGHPHARALDPTPALSNTALFARDAHLCLYCGQQFARPQLTRDHVLPLSRGDAMSGKTWSAPASTATRARAAAPRNRRTCRCWPCPIDPAGSST